MVEAATIKDVAREAGVSISTVSRVLTGNRSTSDVSRRAVEKAARDLGYQVNARASSLRSAKSNVIGVLVPDIRNPFFSDLVYTIQTALFEAGYSTLIGSANEDAELQDRYLRDLFRQQIDGAIIAPQGEDSRLLSEAIGRDIPIVFVDRRLKGADVPSVESDPATGIRQALDALVARGHRRIGFVSGPLNTSTGNDRVTAFKRVGTEVLGSDSIMVGAAGYDEDQCSRSVDTMLADGATALLFGYSPNALHAIAHFRETGVEVGRDVALVSFDAIETFTLLEPPISVIDQHVAEMGQRAVEVLAALMEGESRPSELIPTEFIERASSNGAWMEGERQ